MGIKDSKPLSTPCANESNGMFAIRSKSKFLYDKYATEYRALTARLDYLVLHRFDMLFVAKCVSKFVASS